MAERPDVPDPTSPPDDLPPGGFDGLGLESLTEGVRPSRAQWTAIDTAAHRRGERRPWVVSAAAAVVLVLGVTAVLVARSGREDVVSTGVGSAGTYVLPPSDATDVTAMLQGIGSIIWYTDSNGRTWALRQGLPRTVFATTGTTMALGQDSASPGSVELPNVGTVVVACRTGLQVSPDAVIAVESVTAVFSVGTGSGLLAPNDVSTDERPCSLDDPVVVATSELRVVSGPEFERYIAKVPLSLPGTAVDTTPPGADVTTTSVPAQAPADRGSAEQQIAATVADWKLQAADGSFVNLEDGTEKAAEYTDRFDTAARQSGAAQASDGSGNRNRLLTLRFVTPERAAFTMSMTAVLPSGTFTFDRPGEAILQDGRWVITYRTVVDVLGQACTPPGGYDGCPTN